MNEQQLIAYIKRYGDERADVVGAMEMAGSADVKRHEKHAAGIFTKIEKQVALLFADRITPELRAALSRLRDDHRRFARIPGYHDGPIELGDWTLIHRAIDPAHAATSDGIPEPEGMLPDISAALRLVKAAHVATAEEQRTAAIVDAMYDKSGDAYTAALDVAVAANRVARRARGAVTDAHLAALDAFLGGRS